MSPYAHERPSGGFELTAWLFMRASGVVLLVLALGHLVIMHLINSIDVIDYDFVVRRWATIGWRAYDLAMLLLALLHGLNGIRTLIDDYVRPVIWRRFALWMLGVVGVALIVVGSWAILAFQPQAADTESAVAGRRSQVVEGQLQVARRTPQVVRPATYDLRPIFCDVRHTTCDGSGVSWS